MGSLNACGSVSPRTLSPAARLKPGLRSQSVSTLRGEGKLPWLFFSCFITVVARQGSGVEQGSPRAARGSGGKLNESDCLVLYLKGICHQYLTLPPCSQLSGPGDTSVNSPKLFQCQDP